jgi:hypothetical protein
MAEKLLVYFVVEGPIPLYLSDGKIYWQVEGKVSADGEKTVEPMVFTFATEEHALKFKTDVNNKMEPTVLGEEDG